jgi:hypothetical protein
MCVSYRESGAAQSEITRFLSNIQRDTWLIPCELYSPVWKSQTSYATDSTRPLRRLHTWDFQSTNCIEISGGEFSPGRSGGVERDWRESILRPQIPIKWRADISANSFFKHSGYDISSETACQANSGNGLFLCLWAGTLLILEKKCYSCFQGTSVNVIKK